MTASFEQGLAELEGRLDYRFTDPAMLRTAMSHRSWCAETAGNPPSNERLEFLGDAVLGWVVADLAYQRHLDLAEGRLTDLRKGVVNANALADIAVELDLGQHLLLGKGESAAGGRLKPSILSDALEAVIGAVYLDGGAEAAYQLIVGMLGERIESAAIRFEHADHKTRLQELAARWFDTAPVYVLREEGPDHAKRFYATVMLNGRTEGEGEGRSKKQAEQAAAREACDRLATREPRIGDSRRPLAVLPADA